MLSTSFLHFEVNEAELGMSPSHVLNVEKPQDHVPYQPCRN